jgi:hypothetical protein
LSRESSTDVKEVKASLFKKQQGTDGQTKGDVIC